ncbi:MAG: hydantoinase/oxoprolinase family protein [Burkholderiales bacterium]
MPRPEHAHVIGWDIGGAHVKAGLVRDGRVVDVAQWACPLWQGMEHLERALHLARARWPQLRTATHAVTMTGEMTDLFEHREDGVQRIAALLADVLAPATAEGLRFYAGEGLWCRAADAGAHWQRIASVNWLATASHAAQCIDEGVLIDIGSTTTDLIAFRAGRVLGSSRSDVQRLATGELVYHGVVRTPLCALGPRIAWQGRQLNVMNEFFATAADVYRLTGELDPDHDLYPSADNAPKDLPATRRRLARMIGLDARDAPTDDWLAFARAWRVRQVDELGSQLRRVIDAHGLSDAAVAVSAGCGDFLAADVVARAGARLACRRYGSDVARIAADAAPSVEAVARWAQVCAPSVAVAALFDREQR